jgi:alkylhydroperoxidase family enzyme
MSRVAPTTPEVYIPLFGKDAPLRQQIYAQSPRIAVAYREFAGSLKRHARLPGRLLEILRLRVAFHNQCRSCMSIRYAIGGEDTVGEDLVCSLERPEQAAELSDAEKSALRFADLLATDHLSITDQTFQDLQNYYTEPEIMELCFHVATYVGFGRMGSALDMVDDLPDEYSSSDSVAPWSIAPMTSIQAESAV